ncbi:ABC transporter ATP-binding protein [Synechococcus lacustris]|uniref:ABC transporter ATP-binding protein n=1 Tax=Synechococcus lacustris TaxID=2116544 RepID=UPI0009CD503B|nr:ABC transporter ATP-binding protein [Synechococcus lacustris]MCP9811430.1 ABC transporter ATP-binding protein [Synechococcus lacustris Maggiore-St4-Slac]OON12935.1 MAG: ABC transporter ATP-binding protein [Synechococcus lacustris str. Tous]
MTATPLLELKQLGVRYGNIWAVRQLNLSIASGECVALLGSNGAGKSSTLRAISRLLPAAEGKILWANKCLSSFRTEATVRLGISHCPEGRRVLAKQTVLANLELGAWLRRDKKAIKIDLDYCYQLFPRLAERRLQLAGSLSGGEQQMLAIARALMAKPSLLLLDEPSLGLAPLLVDELMQCLAKLNKDGLTMLLVEQNIYAALAIAQRGYVLEAGELVLEGTAQELRENSNLRRSYLGDE